MLKGSYPVTFKWHTIMPENISKLKALFTV